jgi:hypothetical protein
MTDAPEAPRQEREALIDAMVDAYFDGEGYEWREVKGADHVRASMGAALDVATAGYVTPEAHAADDWESDPAADERWVAGCDFAIFQLASVLGIKPDAFSWDAATEELDGDVRAVIGNALTAALGDDWFPEAHAAALREAWEAGRDAVIAEAKRGIAEIEAVSEQTDYLRAKVFALYQLAENATALTPPAPKGDDR